MEQLYSPAREDEMDARIANVMREDLVGCLSETAAAILPNKTHLLYAFRAEYRLLTANKPGKQDTYFAAFLN